MIDTENPFVRFNEDTETQEQVIPKFNRTVARNIRISEEAMTHLKSLAYRFTGKEDNLSGLLEQIGLCALYVDKPKVEIDNESGTNTEECRQSGYLDGLHGENSIFLQLYGRLQGEFQAAYVRGWYEGRYIRIKGK